MSATRVPLTRGVKPELVRQAASAIRDGRAIVLPTETVYGLVADPRSEASIEQVRDIKRRPPNLVFTHHIADREALTQLAPEPPARIGRLLDRYWPGPLTVVLPDGQGGMVGLRLPAHDFTRAVIREFAPSLFLTSVNRSGEPPLVDPEEIAEKFAEEIDLVFDDGLPPLEQASTVVRWLDGELEVLREGVLSAEEVQTAAARTVLFVCTGNTCRSPLAVVLARRAAAKALGTTDDHVLAHGYRFLSAGVATGEGYPPSEQSVAVAAELGLDLTDHRTRQLSPRLIANADRVFCLGPSHLVAAKSMSPAHADRVELLEKDGGAIPDPFGGDLDTYRRTRDVINRAVETRVAELLTEE